MKLSENFSLGEFLHSDTAIKLGVQHIQKNPPNEIVESLDYLVETTLQPVRSYMAVGFKVNSGWRCKNVNDHIGSTDRSQHLKGEAADIVASETFLNTDKEKVKHARAELDRRIERICGKRPRDDVNANYYLWAYFCIHLDELDIDQVIHEYGSDGKPSWIHVASSGRQDRRRITIKRSGKKYVDVTLEKALLMGC